MYVDFELNSTGDLSFEENIERSKPQKISFVTTKTSTQKVCINFIESEAVTHNSNNYLKVEFFIDNYKPKNSAVIVQDDLAKAQLIALKLKTTLGELPNRKEFGSKLSIFRHDVLDEPSMRLLENYLKTCLKDDIPNLNVVVKPYIDYINGYKQTVMIEIFSSNKILLNHKIER